MCVCVQYLLWAQLKSQILPLTVPHDHRSWIHAVLSTATFEKYPCQLAEQRYLWSEFIAWGFTASFSIRHIWLKKGCKVCVCFFPLAVVLM